MFNIIICHCEEKDINSCTEEQQSIQDINDNLWLDANRKKFKVSLNKNSHDSISQKIRIPEVKLMKLNLSPNSKNLEEWFSFLDSFQAIIHNIPRLPDYHK